MHFIRFCFSICFQINFKSTDRKILEQTETQKANQPINSNRPLSDIKTNQLINWNASNHKHFTRINRNIHSIRQKILWKNDIAWNWIWLKLRFWVAKSTKCKFFHFLAYFRFMKGAIVRTLSVRQRACTLFRTRNCIKFCTLFREGNKLKFC